jgi:hypothetical protein
LIVETISKSWEGINFMEHALLVLTVPAEFSENDKAIMRECAFKAGLISEKNSEKLQFTTERMFVYVFDYSNEFIMIMIKILTKVFLK